jgi:uncharacterized protein YdhG (YjbR/CyaY superfamily)
MVQSQAPTVDAYLAEAPAAHAAQLRQIRELARTLLADYEERMHWGMPAYLQDGRVSFGFAAQKQYVSLYFRTPGTLERNADALRGVRRGKSCLRFRKPAEIQWSLVEKLLEDTRNSGPAPL